MESADEQPGLLHRILPPRLEDAGLEDCALPPDSIHEAFLKAASAVMSRAADGEEDDCVHDPWNDRVGAETELDPPGGCGGENGGDEEKRDKVIVGGEDVREAGGDKAFVDGLIGLEIEDEKKKKEDEDSNDEGPILVGGYA
ncbi:uncharacterized protein LOC126801112 [Argentina anserina]|uniref:uncharacterized protein LOC126801112 n=1 Tax=Argentina anserina TaxID=57926 RepID=UPI0021765B18|nr:uncharacterized protein LOC126801112 [Potentilla anserina]